MNQMASNLAYSGERFLCIKHSKALNNINFVAQRIINCREEVFFVIVAAAQRTQSTTGAPLIIYKNKLLFLLPFAIIKEILYEFAASFLRCKVFQTSFSLLNFRFVSFLMQ